MRNFSKKARLLTMAAAAAIAVIVLCFIPGSPLNKTDTPFGGVGEAFSSARAYSWNGTPQRPGKAPGTGYGAQPKESVADIYANNPLQEGENPGKGPGPDRNPVGVNAPTNQNSPGSQSGSGGSSGQSRPDSAGGDNAAAPQGPSVTLSIDAETYKAGYTIMPATAVSFAEGDTVFDILYRECRANKIQMSSRWTPFYNNFYIEGIDNLYEFSGGELSGWMYSVNGWYPSYGSSHYFLQEGDVIAWRYTCDLGRDIGGEYASQG